MSNPFNPNDRELNDIVGHIIGKRGEQTTSDGERLINRAKAAVEKACHDITMLSLEGRLSTDKRAITAQIGEKLQEVYKQFTPEELLYLLVFRDTTLVLKGLGI